MVREARAWGPAAWMRGAAQWVALSDGARVWLRPARRGDGERLRRLYLSLSDRTRYLYYCAGVPRNDVFAERFAALGRADGRDAFALVAQAGGAVVGMARFDRFTAGNAAEIGILLADAWQSRGLGGHVLRRLAEEARRRTVESFTGDTLWENRCMLRLARRTFPEMRLECASATCHLEMPLGTPERGVWANSPTLDALLPLPRWGRGLGGEGAHPAAMRFYELL